MEHGDQAPLESPNYQSLKRRWYILLIFGLMGTLQAMVWDGWATISDAVLYAYPDWNNSTIALLGNWGEICYLVAVVPLTWLIQAQGIRISALLGISMMAAGTGIRCLQIIYLDHSNAGTIFQILSHVGGILNGTAGVVVCVIPSVISALWFPPGQRTTATGISWVMLELGNALGFLIGPLLVPNPPETKVWINDSSTWSPKEEQMNSVTMRKDIMLLMYSHFGAAVVLLICVLIYFPSKPPVAPSSTSETRREDFRQGLRKLMKNKSIILLVFAYALSQGVQEALLPVLNLDFEPLGIEEDTVGWLGFWSQIVACGTALISGHVADKLIGRFKMVLLILLSISTFSFIWMCFICTQVIPFSIVQLYVSVILGFATNYACTPLFFELASEVAYPVGEGVVAGLMTCVWTIVGIIFLSMFFIKDIGYVWMNWTLIASTIIGIILVLFVKEEYRRTDADNEESESNNT